MKKLFTICFAVLCLAVQAQQEYTTPDTGINWTLQDIVNHRPDAVRFIDDKYQITKSITVAENDTLRFLPGNFIEVDRDLQLTVKGTLLSNATASDSITITAIDTASPYKGLRFENNSRVSIKYTVYTYGGGIKAITPYFSITNSKLAFNKKGVATSGTIELSHGSPLIANNSIVQNDMPAISSPANFDVSAEILNNFIKGNNLKNENRPQINMGAAGDGVLKIIGNTIIGDRNMKKAGGIAVSNLLNAGRTHVIIDGNTVRDNRYGIAILGVNIEARISNNIIEDNTSQNLPGSGGEGIALEMGDGTQNTTLFGNKIRRNLWGVTVINAGELNMGDGAGVTGKNIFSDNGNGGKIYALVNKTPNTILAKDNCWIEGRRSTLAEVAEIIIDQDDDSSYGKVVYDPMSADCGSLSTTESVLSAVQLYPNPASDYFYISGDHLKGLQSINAFSVTGQGTKLTYENGKVNVSHLPAGVYVVRFILNNEVVSRKLIKK